METIVDSRVRRCKKLLTVEASEDWLAWLDDLSDDMGMTRSAMVDFALRHFASAIKFEAKAPKR